MSIISDLLDKYEAKVPNYLKDNPNAQKIMDLNKKLKKLKNDMNNETRGYRLGMVMYYSKDPKNWEVGRQKVIKVQDKYKAQIKKLMKEITELTGRKLQEPDWAENWKFDN